MNLVILHLDPTHQNDSKTFQLNHFIVEIGNLFNPFTDLQLVIDLCFQCINHQFRFIVGKVCFVKCLRSSGILGFSSFECVNFGFWLKVYGGIEGFVIRKMIAMFF